MKIALASDHAGFKLKKELKGFLAERGLEVKDFGTLSEEPVNYVEVGKKAVESVFSGECERAILVCGSGLGMAVVANKFKGIRATPCWSEYTAEVSRRHNNANCLSLGARVLTSDEARAIVRVWLDTPFEGGRHQARLEALDEIEEKNFKPK